MAAISAVGTEIAAKNGGAYCPGSLGSSGNSGICGGLGNTDAA